MIANTHVSRVRALLTSRIFNQIGWVTGSFAAAQVLRLGTNVLLARLLAPQLFGIMLIVNMLRTGVELLSDIGVGQNIVANRNGNNPTFYSTAWTLQILRGVALAAIAAVLTRPAADYFGIPELRDILPVVAVIFIISGLQSPSRFLMQKRLAVKGIAFYDIGTAAASTVIHLALALIMPNVWALVLGLLISTAVSTGASFFLPEGKNLRLTLDRESLGQITAFGKWVFAASLVYFIAMNFDRFFLAKQLPLAMLGIYGIARSFSDMFSQIAQRIGTLLVFPKVAGFDGVSAELRAAIRRPRRRALTLVAIGLSAIVAASDLIIVILYDDRYIAAAFVLPLLMIGAWFSIAAAMGEAVLLGIGKSVHMAQANAAKLLWMVVALPITLSRWGWAEVIMVIAAADLIRYLSLSWSQRREGISFIRQDLMVTLYFFGAVIAWRLLFTLLGLVVSPLEWWHYGAALHA